MKAGAGLYKRANRKQVVLNLLVTMSISVACFGTSYHPTQGKTKVTDGLALQLTEKFTDADKKSVLVLDLAPAFGEPGPFGTWLADQMVASLAGEGQGVELIERHRLGKEIEAQHISPREVSDVKNAVALGKSLGATTVVVGSYGAAENGIGVTIAAFRVVEFGTPSPKFGIGNVFGKMPLTKEITAELKVPLDSLRPKDGIYRAGYGGVSAPSCLKCPVPAGMHVPDIDMQGMLRAHPQGAAVALSFVVTAEGHTQDIKVIQPVGYGFDEQYVKAAKDWEFKPATNVDNRPVSVDFVFHLSFHFK